jgi:DNA polymerase III subunit gamma/tau
MDLGKSFTADAILQSSITETGSDLLIRAPKECSLSLTVPEIQSALQSLGIRAMKVKIEFVAQPVANNGPASPSSPPSSSPDDDEVSRRALADPDVQRFREMFPGQVRSVRNLRD